MIVANKKVSSDTIITVICQTTDAVGDLVSVVGDGPVVRRVDVLNATVRPVVGVLTEKTSPTTGKVQLGGTVRGVYTGLIAGSVYYAGTDGRPTPSFPSASPSVKLFVQPVGIALQSNELRLSETTSLVRVFGRP